MKLFNRGAVIAFLIITNSLHSSDIHALEVPDGTSFDGGIITIKDLAIIHEVKHLFEIKNTSNREIKIIRLASSCGCTTCKPSSDKIAPSQSITLLVEVSLEGKSGHNEHQIVIETDEHQVLQFSIKYDVEIYTKLYPAFLLVEKSHGASAQFEATAYIALSTILDQHNLPDVKLVCSNDGINIKRMHVDISNIPNEITGHYYCVMTFQGIVNSDITSVDAECALTQDGHFVSSIPLIVTEKKKVELSISAFYLGALKLRSPTSIKLQIDGENLTSNTTVELDGANVPYKDIEVGKNSRIISVPVTWVKKGLSRCEGQVTVGVEKLPFTIVANGGD